MGNGSNEIVAVRFLLVSMEKIHFKPLFEAVCFRGTNGSEIERCCSVRDL